MKDNTYCLAQRVKAAVMLQPSLIDVLLKKPTTNVKIVESTMRRLLPYRTSVEIEHIGLKNIAIIRKKLSPLVEHNKFIVECGMDCDEIESRLSVFTPTALPNLYNSLEVLKKYGKVDNDGSIHVHVDISNWLKTNEETLKRNLLGIMNLCEYGISDEVVKIGHEILNESAKIANLYIDPSRFSNTTGCITNKNIKSCNNIRSISYIYSLYAHTYLSDIQKNIELKYNSNNEIYYKRKEIGLPTSSRKAVWISIRLNIKSIEIRTFPCSLDYETIIEFMIESNKLVKKILNYIEYLGNKAIKADEFWLR